MGFHNWKVAQNLKLSVHRLYDAIFATWSIPHHAHALQMMSPHVKLPVSRDCDYVTRHHLHVHVAICVTQPAPLWRQWKDGLPGSDSGDIVPCSSIVHRWDCYTLSCLSKFSDNPSLFLLVHIQKGPTMGANNFLFTQRGARHIAKFGSIFHPICCRPMHSIGSIRFNYKTSLKLRLDWLNGQGTKYI